MQHNKTKLLILFALVFGSLLCIHLSYAAWSEPTVVPPDNNAASPLTISSAAQNKTGPLSISSVTAYTAPGAYAPIYYDSNNTSYYIQPSNTGTSAVFAGNVGIGTTSPQALLTLQKAESNTAGSGGGLGYQASNGGIWHTQRMNTSHTLIWDDYNGSSWVTGLTQTNSGNVGIGTTNPQYTLSIPVTSGIIGAYSDSTHYGSITFYDSGGFMTFDHLWSGDAGGYRFQNAGTTNLFTILGSGNVGIGTTSPGAKLDVIGASTGNGVTIRAGGGGDVVLASGGSLFFDDNYSYSSGNYIRPLAVNTQAFFTSGNERMRITSAGNIGIGTTSPDQKLTVAGTIHSTTGGIEFPDGTTQTTAAGGSSYVSGGHYGYYAYDICGCSDIYIAPMTTSYTCPAGFTYETTGSAPGSYTCGPCGQYVYWATCVKN